MMGWITFAVAVLCLARVIHAGRGVFATTLVAPWCWAIVAVVVLAAVDLVCQNGLVAAEWQAPLRYLAGALSVTPVLALLGAKRPQDRGWQWVVVTLAVVLAVPVGQFLAFGAGEFRISGVWAWLIFGLVAIELVNFVGTANFPRVVGVALFQGLWLSEMLLAPEARARLPLPEMVTNESVCWWAILLAALLLPAPRRLETAAPQRVWLDFRDAFGVAWARRVADRMNQTAELAQWPVRIDWTGFTTRPDRLDPNVQDLINQSLRTVLRRFVAPPWLDQRLGTPPLAAPEPNVPDDHGGSSRKKPARPNGHPHKVTTASPSPSSGRLGAF